MSKIIKLLVDIEFLPFQGLNIGAIFIHDSLTDLALGLGAEQLLEVFRDHVEEKYNVKAGFVTKDAYSYIGNVKNIKSIVVGMSKKEHIKETVASIHKYIL